MNRFAELLDRLAYEPGRNNKLRLITSYFRDVEDPDRGYALAALTGALSFKHAKPGLIRDLIADRTDPVLFALSYDYVGDLSETVALMWPKAGHREVSLRGYPPPQPSPTRGEEVAAVLSNRLATDRRRSSARRRCDDSVPSPLVGEGQGEGYREHGGDDPSHAPQQPAAADPRRGRHHAAHAGQDRTAEATGALARRTRRDRPLGAAETRHRRDADRHLGAAGQDRRRRPRRQGCARDRVDVARADPALPRSVRVAGRPRGKTGQSRSGAVPPGDAGACDRGCGFRPSRCRRFHRGMEMGRHSRAGRQRPRRTRQPAWRGSIRAAAKTSPKAFRTCCRHCTCPAQSMANYWCCATAGCRPSTCCSSV